MTTRGLCGQATRIYLPARIGSPSFNVDTLCRQLTCFKMIRKFLNKFEDPKTPLMGPNIWILKKIGMIMPESKFGKACYLFLHEMGTFFVITQYMELYVIRADLDLVITNMRISMLSTVCVVKANTCVFWQKRWKEVLDYVTAADKEEREDKDPRREQIINSYTKYCRVITYSYWILVFTTVITVTHTPLIRYISELYRDEVSDSKEPFYHIFSSWMPFDKVNYPGNWITVVWHAIICVYGAMTLAAFDVSVMVIMVFFGGKLQLLRERCKLMLGEKGLPITDEEAQSQFRKLHEMHVDLMKYSRIFDSVLSPVMFFYVVMCSLALCASAFQLTSVNTATQKLLMAEYLIFGIAQLFLFCWHSNDVLYQSEHIMRGPYESNWWIATKMQRRNVLLLTGQFKKTVVFTAGPFTHLTLSTFINILKGAYSYYTLLRK